MKKAIQFLCFLCILSSCSAMPEMFKTVDDIATDGAISLEIDKNALQRDTDVSVNVSLKNKSS